MQSSPVRGSKLSDPKFEDKAVYPPKPVVEAISGLHMWKGVPWLMGITSTPIVTPDGEIVRRPGFDEKRDFITLRQQGLNCLIYLIILHKRMQ